MRLTLRARGSASPDLAWERYADLDAWAAWSPQVESVITGGPRRLQQGLRGCAVGAPLLGRPLLRVTFDVGRVDEACRRWGWTVVPARLGVDLPGALGRALSLRLDHAVHPAPGGSSTTLVLHGRAPVVLGYALPALIALTALVRGRGPRRPRRPRR